jgi:hypothetical protein
MRIYKISRSVLNRIIKEENEIAHRSGYNLTVNDLKEALHDRGYFLTEAEGVPEETPMGHEELGDSIDNQIDRYLSDYEKTSKPSTTTESIDWRATTREFLTEAEGDEEDVTADAAGDEEEDAPAEEEPMEAPPKMTINDIDIEAYATDVARLIENYDSLLEIKNTLMRRAQNFIAKSYDEEVVKLFEDSLRETHGMVVGKSDDEFAAEEYEAPPAGEAGPMGGV